MVIEGGCLKFGVLFWFSTLYSVLGLCIIAFGVIMQAVFFNDYMITEASFLSTPGLLVLVGSFVFLIAFVGCCGAVKESHKMISTFSILLLVLFLLELAGGIASYVKRADLENYLEDRLNDTLHDYPNNKEIQKTWNIMQHELACCGINSPADWKDDSGNTTIPASCCKEIPFNEDTNSFECQIINAYQEGCMTKLLDQLKSKSLILALAATGIALIQLLLVCFSCSLARAIRQDYQTV